MEREYQLHLLKNYMYQNRVLTINNECLNVQYKILKEIKKKLVDIENDIIYLKMIVMFTMIYCLTCLIFIFTLFGNTK